MTRSKHLLGGVLLVSGTSIGAGMLGLPVVTAAGGFFPAIVVYLLCYLFMSATGLLLLELCLRMPEGVNLISLSEHFLGKAGKAAAWVIYLFLFYSLSVAYISGGGELLALPSMPPWFGALLFACLFSPAIYLGAKRVDQFNHVLMFGLLISFFLFIVFALPALHPGLLKRMEWMAPWAGMPVIFTSFSYQGVVPTLVTYLKRDTRALRWAILGGTTLTFVIYLVWQLVILGSVPLEGEHGLLWAQEKGLSAVQPLRYQVGNPTLSWIGQVFAFCSITTSFLGVTLGLFDFWADGLQWSKKGWHRVQLFALTFLPPLAITLVYPTLFLRALGFAGGFGCAMLLGLMPILMTYRARYLGKKTDISFAPILGGGKAILGLLFLFIVFELALQLFLELK